MGYRNKLTTLLVAVDQDQWAFDLIKWYATYPGMHYNWRNGSLPFLHFISSDRAEEQFWS
jgi:hypothetical protein